jgi:hypothetical protein
VVVAEGSSTVTRAIVAAGSGVTRTIAGGTPAATGVSVAGVSESTVVVMPLASGAKLLVSASLGAADEAGEEEVVRPRCEARRVLPASEADRCPDAGGDTVEVEPLSATAIPTDWGLARDNPNANAATATRTVLVRAGFDARADTRMTVEEPPSGWR